MAYTPQTWNDGPAGGTPLSAARLTNMEQGIDDAHDLYELGVGATQTSEIGTEESTTSLTYTNLTTTGPTVTVNVGSSGKVLIFGVARIRNGTAEEGGWASVALSGGNTAAATDSRAVGLRASVIDSAQRASFVEMMAGLTAGSTTFTMQYRATAGTAKFAHRELVVIPL